MKADVDKAEHRSLRFGVFAPLLNLFRKGGRYVSRQSFSSITRRIVLLNLAGLIALVSGILYLSEYRAGLIDARIQSLLTQGEIIAGAIAASATADNNTLTVDPEKLTADLADGVLTVRVAQQPKREPKKIAITPTAK